MAARSDTITKWLPCEECDGEVLVTGPPEDFQEYSDWWCDACDRKNYPEDYADMEEVS